MNKKSEKNYISRLILPMLCMVFALWFGIRYMGNADFTKVLTWWITLILLGVSFLPLSVAVFSRFHDGGWMFSKTIALAVSGWLTWFLSSCHIVKFSHRGCSIFVVILCFAANLIGYSLIVQRKNRKKKFLDAFTPDMICSIFTAETVFLCIFVGWCYLKGINPDAYGTERFMDFSYMMSISKTDYMPAADVWYSGNGINYYYVGQYLATFLAKLSGIGIDYSYNLAMMTLATFGFCLPYSLGVNVMRNYILDRRKREHSAETEMPFWRPAAAGTIGGIAVAFAGNLHYPIYKYLYPKWQYLVGSEDHYSYWFPDATRFIGYNPDVDDKTIHEFPIYSYIIGDLHAHVINTIFVFTLLALLFTWLLYRRDTRDSGKYYPLALNGSVKAWFRKVILPEVFRPEILLLAFFVGLFYMTNTWDFAIYFVVSGAVILFCNLFTFRPPTASPKEVGDGKAVFSYLGRSGVFMLTALQAVWFILVWFIVSLPFRLNFESISSSIAFCDRHTSLWQLFVLWGLPVTAVVSFFVILIRDRRREDKALAATEKKAKKSSEEEEPAKGIGMFRVIGHFFGNMTVSEVFILTIGLCAIGLVLLPEIIYVVDIYGGAYKRANTMFKLTYQAFIMFGICMGFVVTRFTWMPENKVRKGIGIVLLLGFLSTVGYFNEGITAWFTGYYDTLDATDFISEQCNTTDDDAIDYINENISGQANILEMCGLSYTYFNRISVFTGNPTILGWQTHEWLWRSNGGENGYEYPAEITKRHDDVITIYTSTDEATVRELIEKYDIDYIYIGECELVDGYSQLSQANEDGTSRKVEGSYYTSINTNVDLLLSLGEVVFQEWTDGDDDGEEGFTSYLIKVNR